MRERNTEDCQIINTAEDRYVERITSSAGCGETKEEEVLTWGKSAEEMNELYGAAQDMRLTGLAEEEITGKEIAEEEITGEEIAEEEITEKEISEEEITEEEITEEEISEEEITGEEIIEVDITEEDSLDESYEEVESEVIIQLSAEEREMIHFYYDKYYKLLINYAYKSCENKMAAEDLVQETFHFAMRREGLAKLKKTNNPGGWLMRVLQYKLMEYGRRVAMLESQDIEDYAQILTAVEARYGITELEMVLDKILTPHEWMLFNMYFIERRSAKEMAMIEGITETNFKVRMCRLRQRIVEEFR